MACSRADTNAMVYDMEWWSRRERDWRNELVRGDRVAVLLGASSELVECTVHDGFSADFSQAWLEVVVYALVTDASGRVHAVHEPERVVSRLSDRR
jgi:hypothetical protein